MGSANLQGDIRTGDRWCWQRQMDETFGAQSLLHLHIDFQNLAGWLYSLLIQHITRVEPLRIRSIRFCYIKDVRGQRMC